MIVRNVFTMLVLFLGMLIHGFSIEKADEKLDKDNYGKVVGYIIDSETGEPARERLAIFVYSYSFNNFPSHLHTFYSDNNGKFSFELKPGNYCIYYGPNLEESIYSAEPLPDVIEYITELKNLNYIEVMKGKITNVVKKAYRAGRLRIILVDENGNKINPKERFYNKISINTSISSRGVLNKQSFGAFMSSNSKLNEGEVELRFLYPALYKIELSFPFIGHGDATFEVEVVAGQTIEKKVVLDMSNGTGVEGVVSTPSGTPIQGASVGVGGGGFYGRGSYITDSNGYYKIINIQTGRCRLEISYEKTEGHFFYKYCEVNIQNNVLLRKDIVLKIN